MVLSWIVKVQPIIWTGLIDLLLKLEAKEMKAPSNIEKIKTPTTASGWNFFSPALVSMTTYNVQKENKYKNGERKRSGKEYRHEVITQCRSKTVASCAKLCWHRLLYSYACLLSWRIPMDTWLEDKTTYIYRILYT